MLRKALIATGGAAAVAGALLVAAAPAEAASAYTTSCDAPLTVTGNVGDQVTITWGSPCYYVWNLNGSYYGGGPYATESGFLDWTSSTPSPVSLHFVPNLLYANDWQQRYQSADPLQSITMTIRGTDGDGHALRPGSIMAVLSDTENNEFNVVYGGRTGEASGTPIEDVIQQVVLPTSGSCDTVDDTSLNWAGVASGGWTKSWGEWAGGGTGGSVCTRTLHYDNGWTVAAA